MGREEREGESGGERVTYCATDHKRNGRGIPKF